MTFCTRINGERLMTKCYYYSKQEHPCVAGKPNQSCCFFLPFWCEEFVFTFFLFFLCPYTQLDFFLLKWSCFNVIEYKSRKLHIYAFYFWNRKLYIYAFYFWNRKLFIYAFYFWNKKLYIYAFYLFFLFPVQILCTLS